MRIRLTESEVIDLLEEVLLIEAMSLEDIYTKYYSDIDREVFDKIASADPTGKPDKKGKYTEWLLNLYKAGRVKVEDLYKATEYLKVFHKFKNRIQEKDIRKYSSLPELYRTVKPFIDNPNQATSKSDELRRIKEGADKVYEDERWLIIVPHTKEAAMAYGENTQWCTAARESENYFDDYVKDYGDSCLFINIDKKNNRKYQFCFDTDEYMDETDEPIEWPIAKTIGLTPGALKFYKPICTDLLTLKYDPQTLTPIYGLDRGYYLSPDSRTILKDAGNKDFKEICTFPKVDEELGSEFRPTCILYRFIPVSDYGDANTILNMFDLTTQSLLFKTEDYLLDISYTPKNKYLICKRFVGQYTDDIICSVFSLDEMKYISEVPTHHMYPLKNCFSNTHYKDNLYIQTIRKQEFHEAIVYDIVTGNEIVRGKPREEIINVGYDRLAFLCLKRKNESGEYDDAFNTLVLYDGTLTDYNASRGRQEEIRNMYRHLV